MIKNFEITLQLTNFNFFKTENRFKRQEDCRKN
jgi:hypothetical protein